ALARALVFRPDVLLLDEPLSNLDAKLRQDVRVEIRELQRQLALTTLMVTHDQEEALTMADRLVVMQDGEVRQVGTQQDLYERPRDRFIASFVGRSSFIEGEIETPGLFRSAGGLALACNAGNAAGPATLALRPERLLIEAAPLPAVDNSLPGVVEFVSYLGATVDMHVRISTKERVVVQIPNRAGSPVPRVGDQVHVAWLAANGIVFPGRLAVVLSAMSGEVLMRPTTTTFASRRHLLKGAAAVTATGLVGSLARAQAKGKVVVGTWGGDYARLLNKNIEQPILIKDGWEVIQDQAGDPQRRSKMLAERRLPRGTTDIQGLSALNMFQMHDAGVIDTIDYGKLKNAANLLPAMKYPYGVGHIYSGKVGVFSPKLVAAAPKSYKEIFDPKHGNKLGIIDIQYQYTLVCAALAAGG